MNSLNLIARLTRDVETKYLADDKVVTNFGIAFDVGFGNRKKAVFLDCAIWGKRAETFAQYVFKGHQVGLTGSLDQDEWVDKATGAKRTKVKMQVSDFTLLSNKEVAQKQGPLARPMARQSDAPAVGEGPALVDDDETDIPW